MLTSEGYKMSTVFIVDDEPDISFILSESFKSKGFDVIAFSDPAKLLSALDTITCHAIVSDIRMPQMTGIDLLEKVNGRSSSSNPKVFFITGFRDYTREQLIEKGAGGVFYKPYELNSVVGHVERYLN